MVKLAVVVATFALLAGTPLSAIGAQHASPTAGAIPEVGEAIVVEVEIGDFFVKPLETDLVAGTPYLFEVTNTGAEIHEFVIEPAEAVDEPLEVEHEGEEVEAEIEDIAPGETKTLLWTFEEPGAYDMACHIPAHYEAGMKTPFTVVSASQDNAAATPGTAETVQVEVGDFFLTPSMTELKVGITYTFQVTNSGKEIHEFVIQPAGALDEPLEREVDGEDVESEIEDIAPGQTKSLEWTFAEPGAYDMACHIPGHYEAGMKTGFEVVP